jgi:hypothetical protein
VHPHGKTNLGFFPLPTSEATRLNKCLTFPPEFSALDPCVGDGVAFSRLLEGTRACRYEIEIDANRAEQSTRLGIETQDANTMDVRCPVEALSLFYLNPPYDFEAGQMNNQRLELVFLEHTYRWLKPGGVLVFCCHSPTSIEAVRELGKTPSFSLRQEHLLKEIDATVVEPDLKAYTEWGDQHRGILGKRAQQPSLNVQTASKRVRRGLHNSCTDSLK